MESVVESFNIIDAQGDELEIRYGYDAPLDAYFISGFYTEQYFDKLVSKGELNWDDESTVFNLGFHNRNPTNTIQRTFNAGFPFTPCKEFPQFNGTPMFKERMTALLVHYLVLIDLSNYDKAEVFEIYKKGLEFLRNHKLLLF